MSLYCYVVAIAQLGYCSRVEGSVVYGGSAMAKLYPREEIGVCDDASSHGFFFTICLRLTKTPSDTSGDQSASPLQLVGGPALYHFLPTETHWRNMRR